jgi:gliding motility-associated-like protein
VSTHSASYTYQWDYTPTDYFHAPYGSPWLAQAGTPDVYNVVITNTVNGCSSSNSVAVTPGTVVASFVPNPSQGFSPLTVNFHNTSPQGATTGTMTTVWNYGNGSSVTTTAVATASGPGFANGSTVYQSAGSYTVVLIIEQATASSTCVGTATAVVTVDLPSDLVIPNVFTPNGDGDNDFFTVQSTNLSTISCQIFDRWGQKMYDVNSTTGNISWDGKNLFGKEVVPGTYFYVLKATGKDGASYDKKGTVTVYR